jgi:hypothetical protein
MLQLDYSPSEKPCHSLELNLILCFIFASSPIPISENEILLSAKNNTFGYLSAYKEFSFLKKAWHLLRPINVPIKPKWLRETVESLPVTIDIP